MSDSEDDGKSKTPEETATNDIVSPLEDSVTATAPATTELDTATATATAPATIEPDTATATATATAPATIEPASASITPQTQTPTKRIKSNSNKSSRRRKVYDIISMHADKSMDDFIKMVNDRLSSKKYVPIGGVTFDERKNVYIQAISLIQPEIKNKKYTRRFRKY